MEAIFWPYNWLQRNTWKKDNVHTAFVILEKVIDKVNWVKLFLVLNELGIKYKVRTIWKLYENEMEVLYEEYESKAHKKRSLAGQLTFTNPFHAYLQKTIHELPTVY